MNEFYKKDIISIKEFNKAQLEQIFTSTDKIMKLNPVERREICKGMDGSTRIRKNRYR